MAWKNQATVTQEDIVSWPAPENGHHRISHE